MPAVSAPSPRGGRRCYTGARVGARGESAIGGASDPRSIDPGKDQSTHDDGMTETIRGVDAYLEAHRADFEEQLKALLRVPSVSAQPRARRRHAAGGVDGPRRPGGHGARGRADRDQAAPARLCRVARRAGQAHLADLRPLRRPAGGAARALALAPLRADRPRRQPLCARGDRRQGPDADPPQGGRGLAEDGRPAAGERQVPDRGRGGGRREPAWRPTWPRTPPGSPATSR